MTKPTMDSERTDVELIKQIQIGGDGLAMEVLVKRYTGLVRSICTRRFGGNMAMADDAAQTVFLILWRRIGVLPSAVNLAGWLALAARNVSLQMVRSESRRVRLESDANNELASDTHSIRDKWSDARESLDDALLELSPRRRDVLMRHYFMGETFEQIAKSLNRSSGAVRNMARLGRFDLRRTLERKGIVLTMAVLVTGLEAEATQLPIGDLYLPIGKNADVSEGVMTAADSVMAEMDRAAAKAMWGWIGVGAAGVVVVGVGVALVASHFQAQPTVGIQPIHGISWRIESVIGNPSVRRGEATATLKVGDTLCAGDRLLTSSNQGVQVVSGSGDRILLREEGELGLFDEKSEIEDAESVEGRVGAAGCFLRVGKGAVVVQTKGSTRLETPHGVVAAAESDFWLMVAESSNSFTRVDVRHGRVHCRPFARATLHADVVNATGDEHLADDGWRVEAGQALCVGTTVGAKIMPSDGHEFSPKYAGVLFAEAARRCSRGEYMLADPSGWIARRTIVKTPLQMKAAAEAMNPLVSNGSIVAEENRLQVIVTDGIRLIPFDVPALDGKRRSIRYELCVLGAGVPRQSTFLRGYADDVPVGLEPRHFGAKPTPVDKGQWVAFAQTWIQVGRLPNGSPVVEWAEQIGADCVVRTFSTWNFEEPGGPFFKVVAGHVALKNVVFEEE